MFEIVALIFSELLISFNSIVFDFPILILPKSNSAGEEVICAFTFVFIPTPETGTLIVSLFSCSTNKVSK